MQFDNSVCKHNLCVCVNEVHQHICLRERVCECAYVQVCMNVYLTEVNYKQRVSGNAMQVAAGFLV